MDLARTEEDSLGTVNVPENALYGAQTQRAIENFRISGHTAHPALIRAYLKIKAAAAAANRSAGALTEAQAAAIRRAATAVLALPEAEWPKVFPIDPYQAGAGTSQNMNVNEVLANEANRQLGAKLGSYEPIHPNDHVNRSQSTNDTFPTAMRLALLEQSAPLIRGLERLSDSFRHKGDAWKHLPKAARTHLQDAVPISLGQEFQAYALTIRKCAIRLRTESDGLRELGIGGSAAGTSLTVPPVYLDEIIPALQRETGERLSLAPDLCESMQSQAPIAAYSSALRLMALELTRICNDLRLLASGPLTGLAEIRLPAVQPGSSIMPGKVNPSILEMANQTWYSVLGFDHAAAFAVQAGQLELNVMMPILAYSLLEATGVATQAVETLRIRCIDGIEPNVERLRRYFESTPQVATALSPKLGYKRTAQLVEEALRTGKSVVELAREQKLMSEDELQKLLP